MPAPTPRASGRDRSQRPNSDLLKNPAPLSMLCVRLLAPRFVEEESGREGAGPPMTLSDAARSVWAKSLNEDGAWLPLWQHMDDSADIAGGLFDRWLSSQRRRGVGCPV